MTGTERNEQAARPATPGGIFRRVMWNIPLGWQLSALYTLLLAVTLALVGTLVYTQQEGFLVQDAAQRLEQTATRVVVSRQPGHAPNDGRGAAAGDTFGRTDGLIPNGGGANGDGPLGSAGMLEILIRGLSGPDVTVAVLDTTGTVITATQGLAGDSAPVMDTVSQDQVAAALSTNAPVRWITTRADNTRHVVTLMPVTWPVTTPDAGGTASTSPATTTYLLEQSASLAAADAALERLGWTLLLGVLGGTLAGVVLGRVVTRGVLRPLDRVATTAEAIAGGDLARRLQLPPGRNEVARLGHTFDYMVGRLVATLEAQRRFVADASHELRTPLTSLKGLTEILMIGAHGNDGHVIEQSARAIHDELDRLSRLVNDLLTLSRLDSASADSGPQPRRVPMDTCPTLAAAAQQMSVLAEEREVQLTQECAVPLPIVGDAGQLKQVLLNLIDNALRYTPAGGEVTVRGRVEGRMIAIAVQDTGTGIAAADLPHIFERFYRGDLSRTRATGNSGLGLAIVRAIIAAHGGTITVESTPGVGTCFTIRLLRVAASTEVLPVDAARQREGRAAPRRHAS